MIDERPVETSPEPWPDGRHATAPSATGSSATVLDGESIEAIAVRAAHHIVRLLGSSGPGAYQLLDARELADALNVSVDYVYGHASDLGAMRLGDGPRARLRFDLSTARRVMLERRQPPRRYRGRA